MRRPVNGNPKNGLCANVRGPVEAVMKFWLVCRIFALALLTSLVSAQTPASLLPVADTYLKTEIRNRGIPGLAVAIIREGRIIATSTYGLADVELSVPVSLDTVFYIASLDKQLTSSGIMLLVQDGKVHLDDEINQYFTDPVPAWKGILVRHLISHASGLPDEVAATVDGQFLASYSTEQLLENVKRQNLLFPPGTGYNYFDAGLFLPSSSPRRPAE